MYDFEKDVKEHNKRFKPQILFLKNRAIIRFAKWLAEKKIISFKRATALIRKYQEKNRLLYK